MSVRTDLKPAELLLRDDFCGECSGGEALQELPDARSGRQIRVILQVALEVILGLIERALREGQMREEQLRRIRKGGIQLECMAATASSGARFSAFRLASTA